MDSTSAATSSNSWLSWQAPFILGLITLVLGIILTFRPTQSLNVIAVLIGVAMIISGIFQIARALDSQEHERVWLGIAGVLFILAGLVLIRHLDLTVALIGLFVGFTWIIQGIAALVTGFSGRSPAGRGWSLFFGVLSLIAGIVVVSAPIGSVAALTVFMGIWLIVLALVEVAGALVFRHSAVKAQAEAVSVPGQRAGRAEPGQPGSTVGTAGESATGGKPSS
jgi:uncharacterized membrane protein HdeD (DUF308 family)